MFVRTKPIAPCSSKPPQPATHGPYCTTVTLCMNIGNVYEGQLKEGKQHGKGRYASADGSI